MYMCELQCNAHVYAFMVFVAIKTILMTSCDLSFIIHTYRNNVLGGMVTVYWDIHDIMHL